MQDPTEEPETLTAEELAKKLRVSPRTIWRMKNSGAIPFIQLGGPNCAVRFLADCTRPTLTVKPASTHVETNKHEKLPGRSPKWRGKNSENNP